MNTQFNMIDTKRADGVYVTFERVTEHDTASTPDDFLFQDPDHEAEDEARLQAWHDDEWHFVGIRARATVTIVRNGCGTIYTLLSPGLWSIESDSDASYFDEVFSDQCGELKSDIQALATLPIVFEA